MRYLLDANIVIAIQLGDASALRHLKRHRRADVGVSSVVLFELYFGAFKSDRADQNLAELELLRFRVAEFDSLDARVAGEVRDRLRRRGTPIGPYDLLIAGQALARDLTLVTRNTGEFARVEGLRVEDWAG